jgi:hypothetical protein
MTDKLTDTFLLIDQIKKSKRFTYENSEVCSLRKSKEDNYFILKDSSIKQRNNDENIILKNRNVQISIPYFLDYSNHTIVSESVTRKNSYKVDSFKSVEFDEKKEAFFRLLIPIKRSLDFFTTIEYDTVSHSSFIIFEKHFDFYEVSDNNKKYLVLESKDKFDFEKFAETSFSILLSYAFLTGDFFQGEQYYFCYDNQQMKTPVCYSFNAFRESISSILRPICTNPHAYDVKNVNMSEFEKVSKRQFASLCEKSVKSTEFRMLLLQIIEASKATLLTSTFMLAVCLEELVEIFLLEQDKQKTLDIQEQMVYADVIEYLEQIECKTEKGTIFLNTILSQVHNLGKNASNMQKIYSLFKDTKLTSREKEALKNRNKLLHGTLPVIKGVKLDSINKIDKAYWYLQLRLYTLVTLAVLNNVGFSNKVLNHYSFYEKAIGFFELNELKYRNVK